MRCLVFRVLSNKMLSCWILPCVSQFLEFLKFWHYRSCLKVMLNKHLKAWQFCKAYILFSWECLNSLNHILFLHRERNTHTPVFLLSGLIGKSRQELSRIWVWLFSDKNQPYIEFYVFLVSGVTVFLNRKLCC